MITIGIATLKERRESLRQVLEALSPQADQIYVYLSRHNTPPPFSFSNVEYIPSGAVSDSDLGDAGKFLFVDQAKDYYMACDDDLDYPANYVEYMIDMISKHGPVVTLHGWDTKSNQRSYHRDRGARYHLFSEQKHAIPVHVAGTGVLAIDKTALPELSIKAFERPNMADLWFSKHCNENHIPRMVAPHAADFLAHSDQVAVKDTIWGWNSRDMKKERFQTDLLNSIVWNKGLSQAA